jgi:protein-disulfide isomerase
MTMTASPVIVFEDLQCSDCVAFQRMLDENLLPRYGATVAFEHRDFPLDKHGWARKAAIVARYFSEIDPHLGMEYRRHALADVKAVDFDGRLAEFARRHSLDGRKALAAAGDPRLAALVEKDVQDGIARGITRTPTVFVGGKIFAETFSTEEISRAIDQALAEAA